MTINPTHALELASRNDGYLVTAGDPVVESLREARLVYTRSAGDGYWIARVIVVASVPYHRSRKYWPRVTEIGMAI